jgi:hypothetical protein
MSREKNTKVFSIMIKTVLKCISIWKNAQGNLENKWPFEKDKSDFPKMVIIVMKLCLNEGH